MTFEKLKINIANMKLGRMFTEGEREYSKQGVISTENGGVSQLGQGYFILKTNNNQTVQGEGVIWSINFE
jgi:hypothetical protein